MVASAVSFHEVAPRAPVAPALAGLFVVECDRDVAAVAIPRAEVSIVVRLGVSSPDGLDVHAMGVAPQVKRKTLRRGMRSVTARLRLGTCEAVLGVPAPALAGRIVALEELWGEAAASRLLERVAGAGDVHAAASLLERAVAERLVRGVRRSDRELAVAAAAEMLTTSNVGEVADELGVSERHLRRTFQETVGVGPKAFARLTRFERAVRAARGAAPVSWAAIAATAGYYDQAHLIAEFRAIAGVTPRALLRELRTGPALP